MRACDARTQYAEVISEGYIHAPHASRTLRSMGKKETALASALARARWSNATAEERAENSRQLAAARWENSTPEERKAAATAAAKARWAKTKKKNREADKKA